MNIREMRKELGYTQNEFSDRYGIPFRSIQNWEAGTRKPPIYVLNLLRSQVENDLINRKTVSLPKYSHQKKDLPKRTDYIGSTSWIKAIQECVGEPIIFALDEALMCQGNFAGRNDEYLVWAYGNDSLCQFNGIILLGNQVSPYHIETKNGISYTNFNRTISDALANESILDMQGITEALSKYYYSNGESFSGIYVDSKYQKGLERLAKNAKEYYDN